MTRDIIEVKYMYVSKRKKTRQAIKKAFDELFFNGYMSVDSLQIISENVDKNKKLINHYFAEGEAKSISENKGKIFIG